jgi:putative hydrolase of the HAD superfamily
VLADIEVVLFDMGGTLIDYPVPTWPIAMGRCLEGVYGYLVRPETERPPPAAVIPGPNDPRTRRGPHPPGTPMVHRLMLSLRRMIRGLSGRTLPRMAEACARTLVAEGKLFDDSVPTLGALEGRGYRLGLVSNTPWGTPEYLWENQLNRFGLARYFETWCFSSAIGFRKPDGRIFRLALDRLGATASRTLFVGDDAEADVGGASKMGMRTAWLVRPTRWRKGRPTAPAAPAADLCLRSLGDLLDHLPAAKNVDLTLRRS